MGKSKWCVSFLSDIYNFCIKFMGIGLNVDSPEIYLVR